MITRRLTSSTPRCTRTSCGSPLEIGEIDTTWVVYGTTKRFDGEVIGIPSPSLFRRSPRELVS